MKALFERLVSDPALRRAVQAFGMRGQISQIYGVTGGQKSLLAAAGLEKVAGATVIITANYENLAQWRTDLRFLLPQREIVELPAADVVNFNATAKSRDIAAQRIETLEKLVGGKSVIVLTTVDGAVQRVQSREEFVGNRLFISRDVAVDRDKLLKELVRFGYERTEQVEGRGQFSARGGIIDIFPINRDLPVRAELFGDDIDSIREFDPLTQRSVTSINEVTILPAFETLTTVCKEVFLSYLSPDGAIIFDEPARLREAITALVKENPELKSSLCTWADLVGAGKVSKAVEIYVSLLLQKAIGVEPAELISITAKGVAPFHRHMELLSDELEGWHSRRCSVLVVLGGQDKCEGLKQVLRKDGFAVLAGSPSPELVDGKVTLVTGLLSGGFEFPLARLVVLTEQDIFGRQKKALRRRVAKDKQIESFRDLKPGDYVVHTTHGIGKYMGIETMEMEGVHKDYLLLRYAGEDKLYIPTDRLQQLQKYIGSEGETPRLHKMGGAEWNRAKSRAKKAVADMAKELIALYAERQKAQGFAFERDTAWQSEFEENFMFEETPDQVTAIKAIKADMESARPMDRLLCGDVGFGKTEVALRAAFKAVMSGKQVAVLVPTTVLAQQHYQTFSNRFADFGLKVEVMSRFRTLKEQKNTLEQVAHGRCDVLIGTHRLLNQEVRFKDLGLLIVDEEQRFGVGQKEKLKQWKHNIDVLTLSATPIPRTLHMSLVGARDMSIIETPPEDRFPVQTYVVEYSEETVREAIRREVKRGGQVYYVHNRVQSIDAVAERLATMMPDIRIGVAHGQMSDDILEQVMLDFYEGEYDLLLCTSIIENGLDVANANTLIVCDADRFGLSQLYQLRGRVGRSHRVAFAYFTYRRDKVLTEIAEKRLNAIKEFTELGAGFKIAMRDLEIRGAGNILGAQQHGYIVSVGFETYCRLLDEAIYEERTGEVYTPPLDPILEFNVEAYLSGDYIDDAVQKVEVYQRLVAVRDENQLDDLVDELVDRFGDPPEPVLNLLAVAEVKNLARRLGMRSVLEKPDLVEVQLVDPPLFDGRNILTVQSKYPGRISVLPSNPPILRIRKAGLKRSLLPWLKEIFGILEKG